MRSDPGLLIDPAYAHLSDLGDPRTLALATTCRAELDATGIAIVPGFLTDAAIEAIVTEAGHLAAGAHHQDVHGTPYLELPSDHWPSGHPRLAQGRSALTAVAYDEFAPESPLRVLYEWDGLMAFVGAALGKDQLYRYDDELGALNVASMVDNDELFWHFDQTDFVVSIALQSSESGGEFECVSMIRSATDEHYPRVARLLAGQDRSQVTTVPMAPGTLMFFEGRRTIHRVAPVTGTTPRLVALLAYDTQPGTCSSELLRLVRYGRATARR